MISIVSGEGSGKVKNLVWAVAVYFSLHCHMVSMEKLADDRATRNEYDSEKRVYLQGADIITHTSCVQTVFVVNPKRHTETSSANS